MQKKKLIIIGASGHGKVLLDIALKTGYEVLGFLDDDKSKKTLAGYPVLGTTEQAWDYFNQSNNLDFKGQELQSDAEGQKAKTYAKAELYCQNQCQAGENDNKFCRMDTGIWFVIGIGSNGIREKIDRLFENRPIPWATLVHPSAVLGTGVRLGEGTVVMANAVINPFASVGRHCIINTAAVVEHDNRIEDYVHISPGAILAGTVRVGESTHIGAGAVIRNNLNIERQCTVGAGTVVVKDIIEPGTYVGVPAKKMIEAR